MKSTIRRIIILLILVTTFLINVSVVNAKTFYSVASGSFSNIENANKQLKLVKSKKFTDAYVQFANGLYTVYISGGYFESLSSATALANTAKQEGLEVIVKESNYDIIYRVVAGSFSIAANATKQLNLVKSKGYSDAYIKNENGLYTVYIGSFASKTNATNVMNAAKKLGIDAIVKTISS